MAYAIFRTAKYKTNHAIGGIMRHHLREKPEEVDGLDPSRTNLNITIGASNRPALFKAVKERIATTTRKTRPDANRIVENIFTASPEFFQDMPYESQKGYLLQCVEFSKEVYGAENIVGAYLHFDEKTPHVHVIAVPIETSTRTTKTTSRQITTLNAGHYLGGSEKCSDLQTRFANFVQGKGYDLQRGEPKRETKRRHVPLREYYADIAASKQAATELLAEAASEASAAAQKRRQAEHELEHLKIERGLVETEREAIQNRYSEADKEWTRARAANRKAQEHQERAQKLAEQGLAGIKGVKRLAAIANRPELAGMLELLAENATARELLALYQHDPKMAQVVQNNVALAIGMSDQNLAPKLDGEKNAVVITALQSLKPQEDGPAEFDWGMPGH